MCVRVKAIANVFYLATQSGIVFSVVNVFLNGDVIKQIELLQISHLADTI